ncbi:MAG: putative selenocysteine system protein, partial [Candidatus Thorarchaeota archaeon]
MDESEFDVKSKCSIPYVDDPSVVFRIAWFAVASAPRTYLKDYRDPGSQEFEGMAIFQSETDESNFLIKLRVNEPASTIEIGAAGENEDEMASYIEQSNERLNDHLDKYRLLSTDVKSKLRRALVAKTCWDKLIFLILNKKPLSEIYFQIAHGREMIIKATEGETMQPISLSTSGWLTKIEKLDREEPL